MKKKREKNTQVWCLNLQRSEKCISTTNAGNQKVKSENGWQGNTALYNRSPKIPFLRNFRKGRESRSNVRFKAA